DQAQELHEGELVLRVIDLAAEERNPGPVFLGVGQKLKGVAGGTGRSSQDADDQVGVKSDQLFHGLRAVVHDLEEERAPGRRHAGEHPGDHVIDVVGQDVGGDGGWDVGIKNLEEIAKALALGLFPESMKVLQRLHVAFEIVVERDAVETQVGPQGALLGSTVEVPALNVVDAGGAEGPCGLRGVAGAPGQVDIGGVV